jgi:hypothetical protein
MSAILVDSCSNYFTSKVREQGQVGDNQGDKGETTEDEEDGVQAFFLPILQIIIIQILLAVVLQIVDPRVVLQADRRVGHLAVAGVAGLNNLMLFSCCIIL